MDTIRYMSIYNQTYSALEAFNDEWPSTAMEAVNVNNEVDQIMNGFNDRLSAAAAKMNAAFDAKKWDEAHAAIDEIEKIIGEWKNKLRSIPDESKWQKGLRLTAKIAATVAAVALIVKSDKVREGIGSTLTKIKVPEKPQQMITQYAAGAVNARSVGYVNNMIKNTYNGFMYDNKDKHAGNKRYMAAHATLDEWIQNCKDVRFAIYEEERKEKAARAGKK